jgi:hypothetical protein
MCGMSDSSAAMMATRKRACGIGMRIPSTAHENFRVSRSFGVLLNNWDLKDDNNKIVRPNKKGGGDRDERIYYVADLGATFGTTGSFFSKLAFFANAPAGTKGDPDGYSKQQFIDGVRNGQVIFHYKGKNKKAIGGISVENARWMGNLLGRLSDKQLSEAMRAGGFNDSEVSVYTRAIRNRIDQLKNLK